MITREELTNAMNSEQPIENINTIICPEKELAPHKGARFDGVHVTSDGCWSALILPQWVKTSDHEHIWRFSCTVDGSFLGWSEI